MNNNEFSLACRILSLGVEGAAGALGVNERTVRRWLTGDRPVPEGIEGRLAVLLDDFEADALLECVADAAETRDAADKWLRIAAKAADKSGVSVAEIADAAGVTRPTGYKLVQE